MALEPDIAERVRSDFGEESEPALALIRESGKTGRVARCIVVASRRSLDSLREYVRLAELDYRDAIIAGEYDPAGRQVRDLRVSFLLDTPEAFWVSEVARMMASRGYTLSSLATRAVTALPFEYAADVGEGRAKFVGPEGGVEVEKKDRRWMIRDDPKDLERYNLNRVFDDERVFRDAVSGYLLMRRRPGA